MSLLGFIAVYTVTWANKICQQYMKHYSKQHKPQFRAENHDVYLLSLYFKIDFPL